MKTITQLQIRSELLGVRMLVVPDKIYGIIDHDYIENNFTPWFLNWCFSSGLSYASESADCDKFARAYASQAHFAAWRRKTKHTGSVGWMGVEQPDKTGHALNIARTEKGWFEIEPQTGKFNPLRDDLNSIFYCIM